MKNWLKVLLLIGIGLVVGFVNGFLGAGGGMLLVPALLWLFGGKTKKAHATAVFVIFPICLVSGLVYVLKGIFDLSMFVPVAVGTLIGGIGGTFLLKNLNNEVINVIFWCVMVFAGCWTIFAK